MTAVDTNLLVYAHREDSPWHEAAMRAMKQLAEGTHSWAIHWPCVHEFLAIVTHPRIYSPPTPPDIALAAVRAWMDSASLHLIGEGPDYFNSTLRVSRLMARIPGHTCTRRPILRPPATRSDIQLLQVVMTQAQSGTRQTPV